MARSQVRYRTTSGITAVKLEEHPGSSLRDPTGILVKIPGGVDVELDGAVSPTGLVTVLWERQAFAVFYEDLTGVAFAEGDRDLPPRGPQELPRARFHQA